MKKSLSFSLKIILIVMLSMAIIISIIVGLIFTVILCMNFSYDDPALPEVKYGEFPFELVYEVDGEIVTVNDVYVWEYDGIGVNEGGKYVDWEGYVKSTKEEDIFISEVDGKKIYCTLGPPEYYMGDPDYDATKDRVPIFYIEERNTVGGVTTYGFNWLTLRDEYNIKLISYHLSAPIENTFKKTE